MPGEFVIRAILLAFLLAAAPAYAQAPPTPPTGSVLGGATALSVSGSTAHVALPASTATFPFVTLANDGAAELFYRTGSSSVVAATTDFPIPAYGCAIGVYIGNATNVAAISGGSATTLRIVQANGALPMSCPGVVGGGGGGGMDTDAGNATAGAFAALVSVASTTTSRDALGLGTANSPVFTGLTLSGIASGSILSTTTGGLLQAAAVTGSGSVVLATSPTLVTPTLGAASVTTINKVTITAPSSSATLTIGNTKTLAVSNSLTFTGTDGSSVSFGAGGTISALAYSGTVADLGGLGTDVATFLATPTSANLAAAVTNETGSGALVFATSPTFVTPILGTPTSGVATNLTGTAAGLTAGNVTTNANLTGPITSSGNATAIASQTGTGSKFVVDTSPTISGLTLNGTTTLPGTSQINTSGFYGVGVVPSAGFHVKASGAGNNQIRIESTGDVGSTGVANLAYYDMNGQIGYLGWGGVADRMDIINNHAAGTLCIATGGFSCRVTIGATGATSFVANATFGSLVVKHGSTVAQFLATSGLVIGAEGYVTDAVTCTFLLTITGGGSTFCPVIYDGANVKGA